MDNAINVNGAYGAQQVDFQAKRTKEAQGISNPYEEKQDGTKKLLLALGGLAAIGAGVYLVKSGKGSELINKVKNNFSKGQANVEDTKNVSQKLKDFMGGVSEKSAGIKTQEEGVQLFGEMQKHQSDAIAALQDKQKKLGTLTEELSKAKAAKKPDAETIKKLETQISNLQKGIANSEFCISSYGTAMESITSNKVVTPTDAMITHMKTGRDSGKLITRGEDMLSQQKKLLSGIEEQIKTFDTKAGDPAKLTELKNKQQAIQGTIESLSQGVYDTRYLIGSGKLEGAIGTLEAQTNVEKLPGVIDGLQKKVDEITTQISGATDAVQKAKLQAQLLETQANMDKQKGILDAAKKLLGITT